MTPTFSTVDVHALDENLSDLSLHIAEEVPVRLMFNGLYAFGTMMLTPDDLEDFALGYCLTEQIVTVPGQIRGVSVTTEADGLLMDITLVGEVLARFLRIAPRARTGHTSCGLCGADAVPPAEAEVAACVLPSGPQVAATAVRRALATLGQGQALNALTRMVHAAAWADTAGNIVIVREDVGRHNALDKLIGACARGAAGPGFCVLTSRYSYEMALKTLRAGIGFVVAISAPTARAHRLAAAAGQTVVAIARHDRQIVFCDAGRLCAPDAG